jgi:hypothetical protein
MAVPPVLTGAVHEIVIYTAESALTRYGVFGGPGRLAAIICNEGD